MMTRGRTRRPDVEAGGRGGGVETNEEEMRERGGWVGVMGE